MVEDKKIDINERMKLLKDFQDELDLGVPSTKYALSPAEYMKKIKNIKIATLAKKQKKYDTKLK